MRNTVDQGNDGVRYRLVALGRGGNLVGVVHVVGLLRDTNEGGALRQLLQWVR